MVGDRAVINAPRSQLLQSSSHMQKIIIIYIRICVTHAKTPKYGEVALRSE